MIFLVMGFALLVVMAAVIGSEFERRRTSLRDRYWVVLSIVVLTLFSLGLMMEGCERLGWMK